MARTARPTISRLRAVLLNYPASASWPSAALDSGWTRWTRVPNEKCTNCYPDCYPTRCDSSGRRGTRLPNPVSFQNLATMLGTSRDADNRISSAVHSTTLPPLQHIGTSDSFPQPSTLGVSDARQIQRRAAGATGLIAQRKTASSRAAESR